MKASSVLLKNIILCAAGCVLVAVAISLFLEPNKIAPGGVSGIAIMLNHVTGVGVGVLTLVINIPLMIIGFIKLGRMFAVSTALCIAVSSVLTDLLAKLSPLTEDKLLAALAGGALFAIGLALVFKTGATTGGTDIVIRLLRLKYRHIKSGVIFFMVDGAISLISGLVFKSADLALYAVLSLSVTTIVMDIVLYGSDEAKLVFIITQKQDDLVSLILEHLDGGASILNARGAYSGEDKRIILCAIRKQLLPKLEELTLKEDKDSFMIVTSASEIYGEGFKQRMNLY